jgi:branched-chain amino acid transport system substrate-binding protein
VRPVLALLAAVLLASPGCGSRVAPADLERTLGPLQVQPAATSARPSGAGDGPGGAGPELHPTGEAAGGVGSSSGSASTSDSELSPAGGRRPTGPTPAGPGGGRPSAAAAVASAAPAAPAPTAAGRTIGVPAAPASEARPGSPIVLGSFGVGSGPLGALVAPIPVAARAWMADVNSRGGLAGHPVKVVFDDDGGDPQRAIAIARRMVDHDGVLAFFATYMVTTLPAVLPYLEQQRIPMIGSSNGSEAADHSPMVFNPQTGADLGTAWSYPLALTSQSDKRNVAVLYCSEASTCVNQYNGVKRIAPEAGMRIVYAGQMSIAQPDYTAQMLAARNAGADVVMCICDPPTQIRMIRSAHRQSWRPLFSATYSMDQEQIKAGGDDVEGLLASATTVPYSTSPKMKPYLDAVSRFVPGGAVGGVGAAAWVQGKLLERIASFVSTEPPTRQAILQGLASLERETLGGLVPPITFPDGDRDRVNLCVVPLRFEGGLFRPLGDDDTNFACAPGWAPARRQEEQTPK